MSYTTTEFKERAAALLMEALGTGELVIEVTRVHQPQTLIGRITRKSIPAAVTLRLRVFQTGTEEPLVDMGEVTLTEGGAVHVRDIHRAFEVNFM